MAKRLLVLLAAALYYAAWLWRFSFTISGTRVFLPTDDVAIAMSYGRTLFQGFGWHWYPGGPGGGVSSPFWTVLCGLASVLVPHPAHTALVLQIFNGLVLLAVVWVSMKVSGSSAAGLVTAFCWPLVNLFYQGWEFSLVSLFLLCGYWAWLRRKWFWLWASLFGVMAVRFPIPSNTFALKLLGYPWWLMLTRGLYVEGFDAILYRLTLFSLAFIPWMIGKVTVDRRAYFGGLVVVAGAELLSVCIGGDAWHGIMFGSRIVISTLPVAIVLAVRHVDQLSLGSNWRKAFFLVLLCSSVAPIMNTVLYEPPQEERRGDMNQTLTAQALWLSEHTSEDAVIATTASGVLVWLLPDRRWVDQLGFNEAHIARLPMRRAPSDENRYTFFFPGHLKFDPRYVFERYRPDVWMGSWCGSGFPDQYAFLESDYHAVELAGRVIYILNGTTKVKE